MAFNDRIFQRSADWLSYIIAARQVLNCNRSNGKRERERNSERVRKREEAIDYGNFHYNAIGSSANLISVIRSYFTQERRISALLLEDSLARLQQCRLSPAGRDSGMFPRSFVLETCSKVDVRGADDLRVVALGCNVDFLRQAAACLSPRSFALETCSEADVQKRMTRMTRE